MARNWFALVAGVLCAAGSVRGQSMQYPLAIAVRPDETVFIVDRNLPGVWQVADGALSLYFQASKKFRTPLNVPRCAAIDKDGKLLVGCSPTRNVYRFGDDRKPVPLTPGGADGIGIPMGIAVNSDGEVFVSDLEQQCIWKLDADGGKPQKFAEIIAPRGVFVDGKNQLWVVSTFKDPVWRIDADGKKEAVVKGRPFRFPSDLAVDAEGNIFVCDSFAKAIWRVAPGGEPQKWVEGEPLDHPVNVAWRGESLLVVDPRAVAVFEIDPSGKIAKLDWKPSDKQ